LDGYYFDEIRRNGYLLLLTTFQRNLDDVEVLPYGNVHKYGYYCYDGGDDDFVVIDRAGDL